MTGMVLPRLIRLFSRLLKWYLEELVFKLSEKGVAVQRYGNLVHTLLLTPLLVISAILVRRLPLVHRSPGWGLLRFAEWFFSERTFRRVLLPTIRDLQNEHIEALAEDRVWKARWVRLRGSMAFWSAVMAQVPVSVARKLYEFWKAAS